MKLPVIAIRNFQLTWLVSGILVLLGLVSYFTMPRAEDPLMDVPEVKIIVINPGTNPRDMESLVADPIEAAVKELDDIKSIKTNIEDGLVSIQVEFLYGTNVDNNFDDVQSAVNGIKNSLPAGIVKLDVDKMSISNVPIIQLALSSSTGDFASMRRFGERLENKIEKLAGIKRVDLEGMASLEVQILLQPAKLHALGLGLEQVQASVSRAAANIPGGHVHAGERRFSVLTSGDFKDLSEIENTVIASRNGKPVYLRNIGTVSISDGLPSYRAFYHDQTTVFLSVLQRPGSNIFDVSEAVYALVDDYKSTLPKSLSLKVVHEQSEGVERRISGFFSNLIQGLILVAVATILVLGRGPSIVVVMAIPVSIFIAIGWLDLTGFAIQQMSIVGLVIALGLLVDNAIVVTENVLRLRRQGLDAKAAAEQGSSQVGMAILSGTLTTVLSFVPMLMMQNSSGSFIRSMPVTVVLTLIASLLVALTLTPLLSSMLKKSAATPTRLQNKLDAFAKLEYRNALKWALQKPKTIMAMAFATFFIALALMPFIGVSLFPKAEKPMIIVNVELPEGASFEQTKQNTLLIEKEIIDKPLVKDVIVNVGRGNPSAYYNVHPGRQTPNTGQLLVKLHDSKLSLVEPFVEDLREQLNHYPGVRISIKEFNQGPGVAAPVSIRVIGEDWQNIRTAATQVENVIRQHEGTVNTDNAIGKHKVDVKLEINRDKAAMLGLPINQIDQNIRAALVGLPMGTYKDKQGDEFNIILKSIDSQEPQLHAFDTLMLQTQAGVMVPLKQVAKVTLQTSMPRFQHHNLERTARITSDVRAGFNTSKVTSQIINTLSELSLPKGVRLSVGGEQESRQESFGGMAKALIVAMLGIFAVLVVQFRSFKQPLIVFSAIPFAATGAFFALFLTGYTFSFTAFVGLTSLVGIVVNNAIILIDTANQKHDQGDGLLDAIMQSAQTRMTPILLTTVTTIAGLLPLTLSGSSMWAPMGWAIIGGLLVSTLLTLFVVPILYVLFTHEQDDQVVTQQVTQS